jgi:hypothetical protein
MKGKNISAMMSSGRDPGFRPVRKDRAEPNTKYLAKLQETKHQKNANNTADLNLHPSSFMLLCSL